MYKLIRFYNQNRKKIFKIILVIVFIIGIIQLLNNLSKNKNGNNSIKNNIVISNNSKNELISSKSAVTGDNVSNYKLEEDTNIIENFMKYCNDKDINSAYSLLTDECKEVMFPTIEDFYNIYYSKIFDEENKSYTVENWVGDTYEVRITGDILATGKLDNSETNQDYITIVKQNGENKLNINNYVGRKNLEKTTEHENIEVNVLSRDTYMDYEIYNLTIINNSENSILLDTGESTKSVYLLDSKDVKYYFYSNEIVQNRLLIQSKYKNTLQIKFSNSYSSSRNIKYLVFSKLILNYDEYKKLDDKSSYTDSFEFKVNV